MEFLAFLFLLVIVHKSANGQKPNFILMNMDDVSHFCFIYVFTDFHDFYLRYLQYFYYHSILHLDQFIQPPDQEPGCFCFVGLITIETALSKREFNPSLVSPEHSIYWSSLSDFARDAP